MISSILSLFKALNSDTGPWSIAFGIAFGMIVGFTPFWSFHNIVIIFIAFLFRIHLGTFWIAVAAFTALSYLFDPLFAQTGESILQNESWVPLWTQLYQSDFWRFTRFNNTVVMGSFAVSLIIFIPVCILSKVLIVRYRQHILSYINRLKIVEVLKGSRLYSMYNNVSN